MIIQLATVEMDKIKFILHKKVSRIKALKNLDKAI
jgi:hypothetical protein